MSRYFTWWAVLSVGLVSATLATSILVFGHFDLRFAYVVQLTAIPAVQALVLTFATRRTRAGSPTATARTLWADPLVRVVLLIDVPVLALGWLARGHHLLAFDGGASLHPAWIGTKTIVAGSLLLWTTRRRTHAPGAGGRVVTAVLGLELLAFGLQPFRPWLNDLSFVLLGTQSTLIRLLVTYAGVFWLGTLTTLAAARAVRIRNPVAAGVIEAATAPAFVGGIIVLLNGYLRGFAIEPWASLALTCASLSASGLLAGAAFAVSADADREP